MNVACSSATFGIQTAADFMRAARPSAVLMVNPEICSGHLNFTRPRQPLHLRRRRTAVIVERADDGRRAAGTSSARS